MGLRTLLVLSLLVSPLFVSGCRSPESKFQELWSKRDEPASTAPPRRLGAREESGRAQVSLDAPQIGSDIALTEFSPNKEFIEFDGATEVARVNNTIPIFAGDVLDPYTLNIREAEKQLTPEQLNRLKGKLIQENLQPHIEKAVLVSALRESIDKEQLEQLNVQLGAAFKEEIERLKNQANVGTRVELEQALEREGVDLETLRGNFEARQMAMFYIGKNADAKMQYSRQELLDWYNENREQYAIRAEARCQQIRVSFTASGGKAEAVRKMQQVVAVLRNGEDFGAVAREFSDGPCRADGGVWDWTTPDSLAEEKVDKALWQVQVGSISEVLETPSAFVLVKVLERQGGDYTPFEDVQDAINTKLVNESRTSAAEEVVRELMDSATISTVFDAQSERLPDQLP
jgi:parvulin-like peptidyl-prolyl isomerase